MAKAKNIIWIMCDQLRHDYLGCTGHPTLKSPNIAAQEFVDRGADPSCADVIDCSKTCSTGSTGQVRCAAP